jgi:diguanylate cyclase (GGDEF)-like protein
VVNDTYGHGVGDVVIKNLGKFLTSHLRRIDIIGRLGGEEFAVILGDTPANRAVKVMDAIRSAFENTPQVAESKEFKVTFSCGIAELLDHDTGVTLSDAADRALYEAKNSGRNKVLRTNQRSGGLAPDEAPKQPASEDHAIESAPLRQRKSAIVLDDDSATCKFVQVFAEEASFDVEIITDSSKFPARYRQKTDLIVLDLNMPHMDGVELIRFLVKQRSEAAVIIISSSDLGVLAAAKNLAEQQNLHIIGTLRKPLNKKTLRDLLEIAYLGRPTKPAATTMVIKPDIGSPELPTVEELRRAIENNELAVHFQPKVSLPEKTFAGAEALARWQHPVKGSIPPDYFIPFAEEHGLIDDLTELVLRKICAFARHWPKDRSPFPVSVNISAKSFNNLYFPERMANILAEGSLAPSNIIVEVTETTLSSDPRHMLEILTRLRLKGFQVSIDDFGTGHSSLSRLHQLPFNELKIDKSFINAIQSDAGSQIIVKNTIDLATSLGLAVIAEGVETTEQMDILEAFGCGFIQGYLISRPLPPEAFESWYISQQY